MSVLKWVINYLAADFRSPKGIGGWISRRMMAMVNADKSAHAIESGFPDAKKGKAWLELGPGHGFATAQIFKSMDPSVVHGIEISDDFRKELQSKFANETEAGLFKLNGSDAKSLPFLQDGSVTYGFGMNVIYFLNPLPEYLKELRRVVEPGGKIVFAVSDIVVGQNPEYFVNTDWNVCKEELEAAGFARVAVSDVINCKGDKKKSYRMITAE